MHMLYVVTITTAVDAKDAHRARSAATDPRVRHYRGDVVAVPITEFEELPEVWRGCIPWGHAPGDERTCRERLKCKSETE